MNRSFKALLCFVVTAVILGNVFVTVDHFVCFRVEGDEWLKRAVCRLMPCMPFLISGYVGLRVYQRSEK